MKKRTCYLAILLSCLVGGISGWYIRIYYTSKQPSRLIYIREDNSKYHYINPLLLVDSPREAPEYIGLKNLISNSISDSERTGQANSISVYFRDLNSGKWVGDNADALYDPSSMLKVGVMIGYLKASDENPNILQKKLDYVASVDPGQHYKPEHPLSSGSYTVQELINAMIIDSDNTSLTALYNNDRQDFIDVLKDLRIPPPPTTDTLDFMSPKIYSDLFRALYSSSYLPRELSEQALQLLTETNFKKGIVEGIASSTEVAHKFGEHTNAINGEPVSRELHDCGIVYYPDHPYFLCIMTKGQDFGKLESAIGNISSIVYKNVSLEK